MSAAEEEKVLTMRKSSVWVMAMVEARLLLEVSPALMVSHWQVLLAW